MPFCGREEKNKIMKTVIITGANGNLGIAVTKEFIDKNYRVIATVSNENSKTDFNSHPNLDIWVINLTDEKETTYFVEKLIQQYTIIDAALLLVGGFAMGDIGNTSGDDLHKQIALNFETAFYITKPLFGHMFNNKKGNIVF